jgi:hypothetical protein
MTSDKLWMIPLLAFTIVPTMVFGLGIVLTLFAEFFDWLTELWEKRRNKA